MAPFLAFAVAAAPVAGAAAGVYSIVEGQRQAKKAESAAEKYSQMQWEQTERQAGEYFDLSRKQMELQTQSQNISTLADLIAKKNVAAEPQVFTLPATTTPNPIEQINAAIDRMFRG